MDLNELSKDRKEILKRLSELPEEDLKGLLKITEHHATVLSIVKKDEAFGIVGAWMKNLALWLTVVVGAYYMGLERLAAFLKNLLGA